MRKRWLLGCVVMLVVVAVGSWGFAQTTKTGPREPVPIGEEMCCSQGVPNIPPGQECIILHMVGEGENLHILSAYYYGDARAWRRIYNLNRDRIRNPNRIYAGQIIKIAVPPCWTARYDLFEFMELERKRREVLARGRKKETKVIKTRERIEPQVTIVTGPSEETTKSVMEQIKEKPKAPPPPPPGEEGGVEEK